MISKDFTYAVVGASDNPEKYGYKVFKDLKENGYKAIPININEKTILGERSYKKLSEVTGHIDVVITVVKPEVTKEIVKQCKTQKIYNVWMQPGSEDPDAIEFCHQNGISCISNACIMIQRGQVDQDIN